MTKVKESLNYLGLAVKAADYKVYTRVNFANSVGSDSLGSGNGIYSGDDVKNPPFWAVDIFDLDGIDIVGDDSYRSNLVDIKGIINMYSENLSGNFSHISENDGSYSNTPSLILTAIQGEGGYSLYDFVTSPFFIRNGSSGVDQGITYYDDSYQLLERDHFQETKNIINSIKKLGSLAVTTKRENFIAFNLESNNPASNITQTIQTETVIATFTTESGALAYLVSTDDYLYILATASATITLSNITIGDIYTGSFNNSNSFITDGAASLSSNTLTLESGVLYQVEVLGNDGLLDSNTWDFVG